MMVSSSGDKYLILFGGPYWNRTNNLLIKSQLLCLVELTARQGSFGINFGHGCQIIFGGFGLIKVLPFIFLLALLAAIFLPVLLSALSARVAFSAARFEPARIEHERAGFVAGCPFIFHRRFNGNRFFLRQRRTGEAAAGDDIGEVDQFPETVKGDAMGHCLFDVDGQEHGLRVTAPADFQCQVGSNRQHDFFPFCGSNAFLQHHGMGTASDAGVEQLRRPVRRLRSREILPKPCPHAMVVDFNLRGWLGQQDLVEVGTAHMAPTVLFVDRLEQFLDFDPAICSRYKTEFVRSTAEHIDNEFFESSGGLLRLHVRTESVISAFNVRRWRVTAAIPNRLSGRSRPPYFRVMAVVSVESVRSVVSVRGYHRFYRLNALGP